MGVVRVRMDTEAKAALHALEEFAILGTGGDVDAGGAVKFVCRFVREVDPRERERVFAVLRRPRILVPGR